MSIGELQPADAHQLLAGDDHQLIDVRERDEYADVHAQGAVNVPLSELAERYTDIPKGQHTILICRSGARSMQAAHFLAQQGYDEAQLHNLQGGTNEWVAQGLPHERPGTEHSGSGHPSNGGAQ